MATMADKRKEIFILSGQSNMAGRGGVHHRHWDNIVPPQCCPNPSILRFSASNQWELARDPLHFDIDAAKPCGVGPGMPFANFLLQQKSIGSEFIGLVPCAIGGTAISEWAKGKKLYDQMVDRAVKAVGNGGGEIKSVLWYQGESDTSRDEDADAYKGRMERLIRDVRDDLGSPELPFIQVAIISGDGRNIEKVREAQFRINLPNVVCVDPKGLALQEDRLHLTTEAQVKLGEMLADAYIKNFSTH